MRSNSQVPNGPTVVVLAQVNLHLSEVLPSCNGKMGECGLDILSAVDQAIMPHDAKTIMTLVLLVAIAAPRSNYIFASLKSARTASLRMYIWPE